jgi:hypothetical protein
VAYSYSGAHRIAVEQSFWLNRKNRNQRYTQNVAAFDPKCTIGRFAGCNGMLPLAAFHCTGWQHNFALGGPITLNWVQN